MSIFRAGMTLDHSFQSIIRDVHMGKILIQTNPVTKESELHFCKLPKNIKDMCVVLMDGMSERKKERKNYKGGERGERKKD